MATESVHFVAVTISAHATKVSAIIKQIRRAFALVIEPIAVRHRFACITTWRQVKTIRQFVIQLALHELAIDRIRVRA
jgi:hypothetical protein